MKHLAWAILAALCVYAIVATAGDVGDAVAKSLS